MVDRRGSSSSLAGARGRDARNGKGGHFARPARAGAPQLPDHTLYDSNEEQYWAEMRKST